MFRQFHFGERGLNLLHSVVYLGNFVFLLLYAFFYDVHGTQQVAQIVLADFLGQRLFLFSQSVYLVRLSQHFVVQFLDDGNVVAVGTLAGGVGLN